MGCGAVCGNISSIHQANHSSQKVIFSLIPRLKHAGQFISSKQYKTFVKQIKQNPLKYRLKASSKLVPREQVDPSILTKWKVIIYCLDSQNTHFNNCLGYKIKKITQENEINHLQNYNDETNPDQQRNHIIQEDSIIYQEKQFTQIEKDIDRTCDLPNHKKKTFQKILKRISNHFPSMGYTQGINFIVGYLLMIGYQEFDVFWMFVHIAINRRYLLLGLFQDKFPLSEVYKRVFKNILHRTNTPLYQHLYGHLHMDESVWVFKWFVTYFIYSFPHEMIKYVFDFVVEVGGLGLIKFAIAITLQLGPILMQQFDICEISIFIQSLRDFDMFNQHLCINKIIQRAYSLEIKNEDFTGISEFPKNFYAEYILANITSQTSNPEPKLEKVQNLNQSDGVFVEESNNDSVPNHLLKQWYQKLLRQRDQFVYSSRNSTDLTKQTKKTQQPSIENELHLLIIPQEQQISVQSPQKPQKENSVNSKHYSLKDSLEVKKVSVPSLPSTGCSLNKKGSQAQNIEDITEIDEVWDEDDHKSNISKNISGKISQQSRTQNGFNMKIRKTSYEDELDKFASTHCNPLGKSKANSKTSSIFTQQKYNSFKPKINNFQILPQRNKSSNFVKVGQNIINNTSINDKQSSNSEYSNKFSQKQKKSKQNDIYGRNYHKIKPKKQTSLHQPLDSLVSNTFQIDKKSVNDCKSSSKDSYIDQQNSFYVSNESLQDQIKNHQLQAGSVRAFDSYRDRISTQQDILTNSLHASHLKGSEPRDIALSNVSEIQIFQAPQVFKKKNRVSSRINGAQKEVSVQILKPSKISHTISEAVIQKEQKSLKKVKIRIDESNMNYEQSYESLYVPSEGRNSNSNRFHQQFQNCEVESVK